MCVHMYKHVPVTFLKASMGSRLIALLPSWIIPMNVVIDVWSLLVRYVPKQNLSSELVEELCFKSCHVGWDKVWELRILIIIYHFWFIAFWVKLIECCVNVQPFQLFWQYLQKCVPPTVPKSLVYTTGKLGLSMRTSKLPPHTLHLVLVDISTIPSGLLWNPSCSINSFIRCLSVWKASSSKN